ncbi:MAG TPA: MFS transporter [Candidatus Aminicenantes bacterium]|nr:MFS transporter [Candidatus Aminicenantes bacterium]HRY64919.1 MFS transporter [Candidatus Aminicenantes bacterium]HRZ71832.1 MFS transporter [Candidatus Aminicenantes bacterium]
MKKRILLSASLFHPLTDAATVITPMVFPLLLARKFLITNYAQIGLLSNLGLLTSLLVQFMVVRVSFRREYRTLMVFSGLGLCASLALIPLARTYAALLLLFLGLRICASFYHPIVIAWVSKSQAGSGRELDDAMGIQSGSGNLGVGLAYLTVGFLAQRWGWRTPHFVWAVFGLVLAGLGAWILRGVSSRSGERPSLRPADWWRSLRSIRRFVPGFFFGGAGWSVAVYYAPSLLNQKYGIPMGQTGLFLALWIGLGTVTGYGYGIWSRRFGRKPVFMASLVGAAAALFLLGFAPTRGLAVVGLLAFGGFLLMTYPSLHTFVGSTVPAAGQTMAFSWVSNIQLVSGALVSLVSGVLSDLLGIAFPFVFTGVLTLAVLAFYAPRGPAFFGGEGRGPDGSPLSREGAI